MSVSKGKIHALIDDRVLCGSGTPARVATVPPRSTKFVTCKRCKTKLRRFGDMK